MHALNLGKVSDVGARITFRVDWGMQVQALYLEGDDTA